MSEASWAPQPWGRWEETYGRQGVWDHFTVWEMRLRTTSQLLSLFSPFPKRSEEIPLKNNVLPASCHWWCLSGEHRTPRHAGNAEDPAWNNLGAPPRTRVHTSQSWLSTTQHRRTLTPHLLYPSSCPRGPVDHLHPTTERGQWAGAHSPLARL